MLAAFSASVYFPLFHSLSVPENLKPQRKSGNRKPAPVFCLQRPGERTVLFGKNSLLLNRHAQMFLQIPAQDKHNRYQKELCQKENHQSRIFIHAGNIIYKNEKGEKHRLSHLYPSPIGGIFVFFMISSMICFFVFFSIFAVPERRIRCNTT